MSETYERTDVSIERVDQDVSGRRGAGYALSFTQPDRRHTEFLTQGELIGLRQEIGAFFNLAGMGDAKRAADPAEAGGEWWTTQERLDHERHQYAQYAKPCRLCVYEARHPVDGGA